MDRRFAKFTEVVVNHYDENSTNELMIDTSLIIAIRSDKLGTEIITSDENFLVAETFNNVRKILAI